MVLSVILLAVGSAHGADVPARIAVPQLADGNESLGALAAAGTVATPRSDVALVARSLSQLPKGRRMLVISGFGSTLLRHPSDAATSRVAVPQQRAGRTSAPTVATPGSVPGPWTSGGERAIGGWVDSLLSGLAARGSSVDSLVIDCEGHLRASALLATVERARSIESDRRWPRFAAANGLVPALASSMGNRDFLQVWDAAAFKWERGAVDRAIAARFARAYPSAAIHYVVRQGAVGPVVVPSRGTESLFGIGGSSASGPGGILADGLDAIGRQASMTGLAQSPWLVSPPSTSGEAAYWDELAIHALMRGSGSLLVSSSDRPASDRARAALATVVAEAGCRAGSWKPLDVRPVDRTGPILAASSILANGSILWRVSVAPAFDRSNSAVLSFEDGGEVSLNLQSGAAGAWIRHPPTRRLVCGSSGIPVVSQPTPSLAAARPLLVNASPVSAADHANHGLSRYVIIYQDVQPGSRGAVTIDVDRVVAAARAELAKTPASWGVLDWEDPHFGIINFGPSHPQYHEAVASINNAMAALKREFPSVRWTIWGGFEMPFWKSGGNWSNFAQPVRDSLIAESVANWSPVFGQCDWIMPWAYDIYDEAMVAPWFKTTLPVAAAQWSAAKVAAAREYQRRSSRALPVVVCLCPFFVGGGTARPWSAIPESQLVQDQVDPAIRAGADGIAIWTPCDWWVQVLERSASSQASSGQSAAFGAVLVDIESAVGAVEWGSAPSASAARRRLEDVIGGMARVCRERLTASQFASRIVP